jgi:hypothetical protein
MAGDARTIPNREVPTATDGNGAACPWLPKVLEQLAAIRRLPQGWDSHGGDPPETRIVDDAETLLKRLCRESPGWSAPHVHPTRSGGVQFEWESANRYFEIEVAADATHFFFQDESAGIEQSATIETTGDVDELFGFLRKLHLSE